MKTSDRINKMPISSIMELYPIADKRKSEGITVHHLNIGDPDIKTPREFFDAIKNYDVETIGYAPARGIPELLDSQRKYYEKFEIIIENEDLLITNGGSEALIYALLTVADFGDNILTTEPYYANYTPMFVQTGVEVKTFPTRVEDGFHLPDKKTITDAIDEKTKAILISNPSNPTGVVLTKEELFLLTEIALEHNLFIISDEVYREFIYSDEEYFGFGNIKELEQNLIIVDSISKRFSACGVRIGSLMSKNKSVIDGVMSLANARLCVPTIEMIGAAALYNMDLNILKSINEEYRNRRDYIISRLKNIPGVTVYEPEGAFYVMPELPVDDADKFCKWMLKEYSLDDETLMLATGASFYQNEEKGKSQVRIAYIKGIEVLDKSMSILENALQEYNSL